MMVRAQRRRRRGTPGRDRSPATPRSPRPGRRSHRRIDEEATDRLGRHRSPSTGSGTPARPCTTASAGWPAPAGSRSTTADGEVITLRDPPRRRAQPRHPPGGAAGRGARGHAVLDQPRRRAGSPSCPARWSCVGGGPIGCELAQVFARFGVRVTVVQHGPRLVPANEPEAAELLAEVFAERGHPGAHRRRAPAGVVRRRRVHARPSTPARSWSPTSCWSPPAARPTSTTSASRPSGSTRPRAPLEVDERLRVRRRGSGRSATSPARARSRTSRCTSPRSRCATSSARTAPPARYHAVPHVTFTDPEVGGVGMTEQQARDAGLTRAHRASPSSSSPRAVSPTARVGTD